MKPLQTLEGLMRHWDCGVYFFFLSAKTERELVKLLIELGSRKKGKIVILINARNNSYFPPC